MHKNLPLVLRILSSSVSISKKAGSIIREKLQSGNLNIVDKVRAFTVVVVFVIYFVLFSFRGSKIFKRKPIVVRRSVLSSRYPHNFRRFRLLARRLVFVFLNLQ